jgi:hypothetical protein
MPIGKGMGCDMAVAGGPKAITNNIVYLYDIANFKVYRNSNIEKVFGTETTTLYNGPTYNSANGGYLSFDGTNDYMEFNIGSANISTTMTVEFFARIKAGGANMVMAWGAYDFSMFYDSYVGFNTANSDWYGFSGQTGLINNWVHYVLEMRSDVSYSNNKIYTNGTLRSLSQLAGTEGGKSFNNGVGNFATWAGGSNPFAPMDLALVRIYKGALQPQQVYDNFEAHRGRFGI